VELGKSLDGWWNLMQIQFRVSIDDWKTNLTKIFTGEEGSEFGGAGSVAHDLIGPFLTSIVGDLPSIATQLAVWGYKNIFHPIQIAWQTLVNLVVDFFTKGQNSERPASGVKD